MCSLISILIAIPAAAYSSSLLPQLKALLTHPDARVRTRIAEQPRLAPEHILVLSGDDSHEVRIAVADNAATPLPILEMLAQDSHPDVRYAIAENANVPLHLLNCLLHDENPYIACRARETLERLEESNSKTKFPTSRCA